MHVAALDRILVNSRGPAAEIIRHTRAAAALLKFIALCSSQSKQQAVHCHPIVARQSTLHSISSFAFEFRTRPAELCLGLTHAHDHDHGHGHASASGSTPTSRSNSNSKHCSKSNSMLQASAANAWSAGARTRQLADALRRQTTAHFSVCHCHCLRDAATFDSNPCVLCAGAAHR